MLAQVKLGLMLAVTAAIARLPVAEGQQLLADRHGDPLPAGAVARLGTVRWRLPLPASYVLAFAPDGKTFYTASPFGGIHLWDSASGAILRRLADDDPLALSNNVFVFSADATTLAVGRSAGTIVILDTATGKERCRCLGHQGIVHRLALSADGRVLVSHADDGTIRLWDARTGRQRRRQQLPVVSQKGQSYYPYVSFALTADGKTLAWTTQDPRRQDNERPVTHVCDAESGREQQRLTGSEGFLSDLAFSPDGRLLVSVAHDDALGLWDVQTGQPVPSFRDPRGRNPQFRGSQFVVFSPDSKRLAVMGFPPPHTLVLEAATGREVCRIPAMTRGAGRLLFTPDSKTLVLLRAPFLVGIETPLIRRFDAATGKERVDYPGHLAGVQSVTLSADGRTLTSTGWDSAVNVWDAATGKHLRRLTVGDATGPPRNPPAVPAPHGRLVATVRGKEFRVQEVDTGRVLWARDGEGLPISAVSFSPDGRLLAAPVPGGAVALRDAATGKLLRECRGLAAAARTAFSAAGDRLLAWGSSPGPAGGKEPPVEAAIWDPATGGLRRLLRDLPASADKMALSRDGRWLVLLLAGGDDPKIELREVATGRARLRIEQPGPVQALALAPDGDVLVVSCLEGRPADPGVSFRCYDASSGRLLREQRGHRGTVQALAFSGDGRRLVSGSNDTTILVWDLPGVLPRRPAPAAAGPAELEALWADLAGDDAARAYRAIQALAAAPDRALPFLKARLRPAPAPVDPGRLARLLADLDSERFNVRAKAATELERLGEAVEPALERTLGGQVALEKRRRLEELLRKVGKLREKAPPPERLRQLRALEVLEQAGTAEARQLLDELAGGAADAWLTQEARASARRLAGRTGKTP
jgi:WD40 repeat protein